MFPKLLSRLRGKVLKKYYIIGYWIDVQECKEKLYVEGCSWQTNKQSVVLFKQRVERAHGLRESQRDWGVSSQNKSEPENTLICETEMSHRAFVVIVSVITGQPTVTKRPPVGQKWRQNIQQGGGAYIPCQWIIRCPDGNVEEVEEKNWESNFRAWWWKCWYGYRGKLINFDKILRIARYRILQLYDHSPQPRQTYIISRFEKRQTNSVCHRTNTVRDQANHCSSHWYVGFKCLGPLLTSLCLSRFKNYQRKTTVIWCGNFVGYLWRELFFIHIMQILADERQVQDEEEGAKKTKRKAFQCLWK